MNATTGIVDHKCFGHSVLNSRLLLAWLLFCGSIALHVTDEATHNFLAVYNPTVLAFRDHVPWLPMPTFSFGVWITGLAVGIVLLVLLSPLFARGARSIRPFVYVLSVLMIGNGVQHIIGTILGHTVATVQFPRPMPGFYSSPILIAASIYLLIQLRNTARQKAQA